MMKNIQIRKKITSYYKDKEINVKEGYYDREVNYTIKIRRLSFGYLSPLARRVRSLHLFIVLAPQKKCCPRRTVQSSLNKHVERYFGFNVPVLVKYGKEPSRRSN